MTRMASRQKRVTVRRPWTTATAVLTAAHHGFELSSGVGLVLQPELGLGFASALWGTGIPLWIRLAAKRDDTKWDPLLSAWSRASLAGVLVHFSLWPWRPNKLGIPVLVEAEALRSSTLPAYNALLYLWGAASALSIIREVRPGARRWALVGLATVPLSRRSAQHHFSWLEQEAMTNPAPAETEARFEPERRASLGPWVSVFRSTTDGHSWPPTSSSPSRSSPVGRVNEHRSSGRSTTPSRTRTTGILARASS